MCFQALLISIVASLSSTTVDLSVPQLIEQARQQVGEKKIAEALTSYQAVLDHPDAIAYERVTSKLAMASLYKDQKDSAKAAALCESILADAKDNRRIQRMMEWVSAHLTLAEVYSATGRADDAERLLTTAAGLDAKAITSGEYMVGRAQYLLAYRYLEKKDYEKSAKTFLNLMTRFSWSYGQEYVANGFTQTIREAAASGHALGANSGVIDQIRQAQLACLERPEVCGLLQLSLAQLAIEQSETSALLEAKVAVTVSSTPKQLEEAVRVLTTSLKAVDGNLARVNAFLEFQKYGSVGPDGKIGTEDDLTDPLAETKSAESSPRDEFFTARLKGMGTDWKSRLHRSTACRLWGRPDLALAELRHAFRVCPYDQKALQETTDRIVQVLREMTGNPQVGEQFVSYLSHGKAGPDGKEGTEDDLVIAFAAKSDSQ